MGYSHNLSPNLEGKEESERVTEGAMERRSWQRRLRPQIEIILKLISSKNTLPNGLADLLFMEKL